MTCSCQFISTQHEPVVPCAAAYWLKAAVNAAQHGSASAQRETQRQYREHIEAARQAAYGEGVRDAA